MNLRERVASWIAGKSVTSTGNFGWTTAATAGDGGAKLTDAYSQVVWVMRAIKEISQPIAAVPIGFSAERRRGRLKQGAVEDPQLMDFWAAPFADLTLFAGIEATVGWLKLRGEAFWLMPLAATGVPFPEVATGSPAKLQIARPDRMRPTRPKDPATDWVYTDARGRMTALLAAQVAHIKFWNPHDAVRGMSELGAAWNAAEADYLGGRYAANLMRNNADQGLIITTDGMMDDAQREQVKAQLRMKQRLAADGQFVPVFLTGPNLQVQEQQAQGLDANVLVSRLQNRHEIAAAFGVPMSIFDTKASYSIGSSSDYYRLIHGTCVPTSELIADGIDQVNRVVFRSALTAYFDFDEHPVMQAVRAERITAGRTLWDAGMPWRSVSDYLRLDLPEFEGWDVGYLPFSVSPVGDTARPSGGLAVDDDDFAELLGDESGGADEIIQEMMCALHGGGGKTTNGNFQRTRNPAEVRRWEAMMGKRRAVIAAYRARVNRWLMELRREVLGKIERAPQKTGPASRAAAADFLFDLGNAARVFAAALRKQAASALLTAGQELFAEIGKDDPFTMPPARVLEILRDRENKLSGVAQDAYDELKASLEAGISAGESTAKLANRARAVFNGLSKERAKTIAITETGAVYGAGRHEAIEQAGITRRQWLASGNPNMRPTHEAANGQVVGINEPFNVGGARLMFPGDPSGPPQETINCHCVEIAVGE